MIVNEKKSKKPFISMKDLKIPVNRISENGMLFHPEMLIQHYRLINYQDPDDGSTKLVELFKNKNPFQVKNSKEKKDKIPLETSTIDNLSLKKAKIFKEQQSKNSKIKIFNFFYRKRKYFWESIF